MWRPRVLVAVMVAVVTLGACGSGGTELSSTEHFEFGAASITLDAFRASRTSQGFQCPGRNFYYTTVSINCARGCSLFLHPRAVYPKGSSETPYTPELPNGLQVDISAGQAATLEWGFPCSSTRPEKLSISIDDQTGETASNKVTFLLPQGQLPFRRDGA